jgi:large subunit ribosomal protein L15
MTVARGGKRGKTAGRGGKGQSARAGNKRRPEWRDIIKKLPKLRGRGKNSNKGFQKVMAVINVGLIEEIFKAGDAVNPITLAEKAAISTRSGSLPTVKILGDGEITKAVKISECYISESAKIKIEKAGGSVVTKIENVISKAAPAKKVSPKKEVVTTKKVK